MNGAGGKRATGMGGLPAPPGAAQTKKGRAMPSPKTPVGADQNFQFTPARTMLPVSL